MNNHYYKKLNKRNDIYLFKIVSLSDKSVTIQININNFRSKDGQVVKRYTLKDDEGKEEDEIGLIKYDIYLENIKEKYYNIIGIGNEIKADVGVTFNSSTIVERLEVVFIC